MNERTEILLRDLAAKLGTTVEHLWPLLIKATVTSWWTHTLAAFVALLACFWLARLCRRKIGDQDFIMSDWSLPYIVSVIAAVIMVALCVYQLADAWIIFNPEAATVDWLLKSKS